MRLGEMMDSFARPSARKRAEDRVPSAVLALRLYSSSADLMTALDFSFEEIEEPLLSRLRSLLGRLLRVFPGLSRDVVVLGYFFADRVENRDARNQILERFRRAGWKRRKSDGDSTGAAVVRLTDAVSAMEARLLDFREAMPASAPAEIRATIAQAFATMSQIKNDATQLSRDFAQSVEDFSL